jgi:hypothetical protein
MSEGQTPSDLSRDFAEHTTPEQRNKDLHHHIDPGFIHWRKCFWLIGAEGRSLYEKYANAGNDHFANVANGHLLVDIVLHVLAKAQVPTLSEVLVAPVEGQLFSSTEIVKGNRSFWKAKRPSNRILTAFPTRMRIMLEYGKEHIVSDTLRSELSHGENRLSIVGQVRSVVTNSNVVVHPLIIGSPWLDHPRNRDSGLDLGWLMWHGVTWFETFCDDIDEFQRVQTLPAPLVEEWHSVMSVLPEVEVKSRIASILADGIQKDWGGEQHDHYSAHVHLSGRRTTAAFVFKGPSRFTPMTPAMLGKNADQIVRLASSSARLLVVQHSHEITDSVRLMLRAFAVAPHNPRRYCLIDGRDTFRILRAYNRL